MPTYDELRTLQERYRWTDADLLEVLSDYLDTHYATKKEVIQFLTDFGKIEETELEE